MSTEVALPTDRVVVLGPAGCGKTTDALQHASSFVETYGARLDDYQRVLMLSFSRAAIARMWETLMRQLPASQRSRVVIETFDGLMWRLLTRFGRYLGLGLEPRLVSRFELATGLARPQGSITFDEFEPQVLRLLIGSPSLATALQHRYPLVIVDEFQDTGDGHWELVKLLSAGGALRCYADPSQAIFRTYAQALARLEDARVFGCRVDQMPAGSHRDQSPGQAISALAQAIRDASDVVERARELRVAKALESHRYEHYNQLGWKVKLVIRDIRRRNPEWSIGVITLRRSQIERISSAFWQEQPTAPWKLAHTVIGRDERILAVDPFLLEAWARLCGKRVDDWTLLRFAGVAVAAVAGDDPPVGTAAELLNAARESRAGSGPARRVLAAVPQGEVLLSDPAAFARVDQAVRAVRLDRFNEFAGPRLEVLRRRVERLAAGVRAAPEAIVAGLKVNAAADAARDKREGPRSVQLMGIDSCKGREFHAVVLANAPFDPFPRPADAPEYAAARAKLFTACARARHFIAVVAPNQHPSLLLTELL